MDQAASAMGGICMMDFADEKSPVVTPVPFSFAETGYKLCLVNVGGDHADLTHLYAAIPERMKKVAGLFGKEKLCEISLGDLLSSLPAVREKAGDEAALSALHFCMETDRVIREKDALVKGDFDAFLKEVIASGNSSFQALGNVWIPMEGANQGAAVALCLAAEILSKKGAWRIHGCGFGGTTQNFVPDEKVSLFKERIEAVFGKESCQVLSIRPVGPVRVI
jgi:galactokinase